MNRRFAITRPQSRRDFHLRDNVAQGTDLFDNVGLLRADYSRKPAFAGFGSAIRRYGTRRR